jgi:hypothetical protein
MGSWNEWAHVLVGAGYSGSIMLVILWGLNSRRVEEKRQGNSLYFIAATYFGIAYGLTTTFHSRIWHWPLTIVTITVVLSYFVVAWISAII